MKTTSKIGLSLVTITAITAAGFGLSNIILVGAQSAPATTQNTAPAFDPPANPEAGLIDAISTKFNLDKTQVQQVFDDYRTAQGQKRLDALSVKLEAQVTAGKITEDQKNALIQKLKDMETKMQALKNVTDAAQRKTQAKAIHDDFKKWLTDNKIPNLGFMGKGMRGHNMKMWGMEKGRGSRGMGMGGMTGNPGSTAPNAANGNVNNQ